MSETDWDFERQKSETKDTLLHLQEEQGVVTGQDEIVTLDLFLRPESGADESKLERALAMFGYAGEPHDDPENGPTYSISIPDVSLTLDGIWLHEERVSKIGLSWGYTPDGWGFFEP